MCKERQIGHFFLTWENAFFNFAFIRPILEYADIVRDIFTQANTYCIQITYK